MPRPIYFLSFQISYKFHTVISSCIGVLSLGIITDPGKSRSHELAKQLNYNSLLYM